jgi:hypothetical protein
MVSKDSIELSFNFAGDAVRVLIQSKESGKVLGYGEIPILKEGEKQP